VHVIVNLIVDARYASIDIITVTAQKLYSLLSSYSLYDGGSKQVPTLSSLLATLQRALLSSALAASASALPPSV
jgi:hypothetical protein